MMRPLEELKHSIRTHLLVMSGPTPQLAVLLVKVIDFLDDVDVERKTSEMTKLAYVIVESVALYIHQSIDTEIKRNKPLADKMMGASDNLLIAIAKNRLPIDPLLSKLIILKEIAMCYRALAIITKANYPSIIDCDGNIL